MFDLFELFVTSRKRIPDRELMEFKEQLHRRMKRRCKRRVNFLDRANCRERISHQRAVEHNSLAYWLGRELGDLYDPYKLQDKQQEEFASHLHF